MGEIAFVIRAEPTEVLGYVTLAEDNIESLIAATEGMHITDYCKVMMCYLTYLADMNPMEWNIELAEPTCPSLWIEITVMVGTSYALW